MDSFKAMMPGPGHDMPDEQRVVSDMAGFPQRTNLPDPWNLYHFYSSTSNSDPWVPRHTIPQDGPQFPAKRNSYSPTSALQAGHYAPSRSNAAHDYTVSDSGYESKAKKSAENTSVFEGMDRSQDARSVTGRMADFHPFGVAAPEQFVNSSPASQRDYQQQQWAPQNVSQECRPSLPASGLWCGTCSRHVKNKSELKKHDQRHNKPHKCEVPGCTRKEGFSTTNDLDRHKRSVHSAEGVKFRCRIGPCASKEKTWPRADNFRSHLKRVHNHIVEADGDLTDFMIGTPQTATPERPVYLEGVGSSLMDYPDVSSVTGQPWYNSRPPAVLDMSEAIPLSVPVSVSFPTQQRIEDANGTDLALSQLRPCIAPTMNHPPRPSLVTSDCEASAGSSVDLSEDVLPGPRKMECLSNTVATASMSATTELAPAERAQEAERVIDPPKTTTETPEVVVDAPLSISSEDADDQTTSHEDGDNLTSENDEADGDGEDEGEEEEPSIETPTETQSEKPDEATFLQLLKDVPSDILEKFLKDRKIEMSKNAKSNATTPAETHPCKKCNKAFARACELKKHLKRHSKPYGCTFAKCDRRFGSKNDWKRHENSQHMQLETWKCHEPTSEGKEGKGAVCGKVFSRREQFKSHLSSHHSISDTVKLDKELQERRIGRNGDSSFWCGFCVKIVQLSKEPHSWTERFNHIDDHFCGKNEKPQQDIADWQFLDDSETADGSSSGPSSDDSSTEDLVVPKPEPALPEPASPPMNNKKRSAEDDILPEAKRNRG